MIDSTRPHLSIGVVLALCLGLSGGASASSARGGRCAAFQPVQPDSPASQSAEALDAPVLVVGPSATEESPLTVDYSHGPAFWEFENRVHEDEVFFNLQVKTPAKRGLHVRIDFANGEVNEADLFLYGEQGQRVASSATFGVASPVGFSDPGNGGVGYDYIPGYRAASCDGFTVESRALWGPGGDATLSLWLGPIGKDIPNEDGQE